MKKKRFNENQILSILKEYEAGLSAVDLSRKHGISSDASKPIPLRFQETFNQSARFARNF